MPTTELQAFDVVARVTRGSSLSVSFRVGAKPQIVVPTSPGPRDLRLLWAGQGYPRDVARALDSDAGDSTTFPVVVARRFSPGSISMLEERGLSWVSEDGNARIDIDGSHLSFGRMDIRATGDLALETSRGAKVTKWSDGKSSIAETLLAARSRDHVDRDEHLVPRGWQLAESTGLSAAMVSKTLSWFDEEGWTRPDGPRRGRTSTRSWTDPGGLLSSWASWIAASPENPRRFHGLGRDAAPLAHPLSSALGDRVAISGRVAAELEAGRSTSTPQLRLYADAHLSTSRLEDALRGLGLEEVDEGGRLVVLRAPSSTLRTSRMISDIRVASPARIYADTLREGLRSDETAQFYRDARIGF